MCNKEQKCEEFKRVEFVELEWGGGRFLIVEAAKDKILYFMEKIDIQGRKHWDGGSELTGYVKPPFMSAILHAIANKPK